MNGEVRSHFAVGLLLLTCALSSRCSEGASTATTAAAAASAGRDTTILRRLVEMVRNVEDSRGHLSVKTETPLVSRAWTSPTEPKDLRNKDRRVKAVGE